MNDSRFWEARREDDAENLNEIIEDPEVQKAFQRKQELLAERRKKRNEGLGIKGPADTPFLLLNISDKEVARGTKSFRSWQMEIDQEFRDSKTWFHHQSGSWVREIAAPKEPIGKGYCLKEPGQDPKYESACFQCRVVGTVTFGILGVWSLVERMHYARGHGMRRFYGTLGTGFLALSAMRAFDLTTMDVSNHISAWWNDDVAK